MGQIKQIKKQDRGSIIDHTTTVDGVKTQAIVRQ